MGLFLSNQRTCNFKRVEWTLVALLFPVLLPLNWNIDIAVDCVQQSRVDKTLDFCPEDWKESHRDQKVTDKEEGSTWLSDFCKSACELLGLLPSCTYMDLILNNKWTVIQVRTKWRERPLPRSQTGHWVAYILDRSKWLYKGFKNGTDIKITIHRNLLGPCNMNPIDQMPSKTKY